MTEQTQPTDAELRTWVQSLIADDDSVRTNDERDHMNFARAVLAKWGSQPAVAGESVDRADAVNLARNALGPYNCAITKKGVRVLAEAVLSMDAALTTPTQAQAGAVPLTDPEFVKCIKAAGFKTWDGRWWELKRQIEEAHGIKGGRDGDV